MAKKVSVKKKEKTAKQIKKETEAISENRKSVSDAVIKLAKICSSLEGYKFELHSENDPLRQADLMNIINSATEARDHLETILKVVGMEAKQIRKMQDSALKSAGIIPRNKRRKKKD